MPDQVLRAVLEVDAQKGIVSIRQFREETEKLGGAARGKAKPGLDDASRSARDAAKSHREGAEAAQLLSARMGIALPRSISQYLAKSSLIGPALRAAFSVGIVVTFAAGLVALVNNINEVGGAIQRAGVGFQTAWDRLGAFLGLSDGLLAAGEDYMKVLELTRPLEDQLRQARHAANQVGLTGFAQLSARRAQELDELRAGTQKVEDEAKKRFGIGELFSQATTEARRRQTQIQEEIERKFTKEFLQLKQQELMEIQNLEGQRQLVGLKGLPLIQKRLEVELKLIDALENERKKSHEVAEAMRDLARAKSADEEKEFAKALDDTARALHNQALLAGLAGSAQLREKRRQMIEEAKRDLEEAGLSAIEFNRRFEQAVADIDRIIFAEAEEQARQHRDIILGLERGLAMQRAESTGNFVIIALAQEKRRVDETVEQLKRLGAAQEEIDQAVAIIHQQTVEQIASDWADLTTDLITGARSWKDVWQDQLKLMLRGFIQMITRMVLNWIKGLDQMADAWDKIMGGLGSPGGGAGGLIIVNFIPSFPHGGLVGDAVKNFRAIHGPAGHVLAWVEPDEGVLNRGAMRILGRPRFEALNRTGGGSGQASPGAGGLPSFQGGGLVGPAPAAPGPSGPVYVQMVFPGVADPRGFEAALQRHEGVIIRMVDRAKAERGF